MKYKVSRYIDMQKIIFAAVFIAGTWFIGLEGLLPSLLLLGMFFLFKTIFVKFKHNSFRFAALLLFLHFSWMLSGFIFILYSGQSNSISIMVVTVTEIILYGVLGSVILLRPSMIYAISIVVLELCVLSLNIFHIAVIKVTAIQFKVLMVHMGLRFLIITCTIYGIKRLLKFYKPTEANLP